jgi:hypothetical protein
MSTISGRLVSSDSTFASSEKPLPDVGDAKYYIDTGCSAGFAGPAADLGKKSGSMVLLPAASLACRWAIDAPASHSSPHFLRFPQADRHIRFVFLETAAPVGATVIISLLMV